LKEGYPETAVGFDVPGDPGQQDALWQGRRSALQVLYTYDPRKRPLTMIECVVLPGMRKTPGIHPLYGRGVWRRSRWWPALTDTRGL